MSKDSVIIYKERTIDVLQRELDCIKQIELRRLYKIKENDWDDTLRKRRDYESWGYIECFNTESVRFCIVASDNPRYSRIRKGRHRGNITAYGYDCLADRLTRAKKDDPPLLVGLKYRLPELEAILKGKSRVKLD